MERGSSWSRRLSQQGQGATEYLIIVALIVIAAIGVYSFFGQITGPKPPAQEAAAKDGAGGQPGAAKGAGGESQKVGTAK